MNKIRCDRVSIKSIFRKFLVIGGLIFFILVSLPGAWQFADNFDSSSNNFSNSTTVIEKDTITQDTVADINHPNTNVLTDTGKGLDVTIIYYEKIKSHTIPKLIDIDHYSPWKYDREAVNKAREQIPIIPRFKYYTYNY